METTINSITVSGGANAINNIIPRNSLKDVQADVLRDLKNAIVNSMGPAGSNSLILRGNTNESLVAEYSKDGNKIIKHIIYQNPIEMAVKTEVENATRNIEKEVGDGTSTVVVMSSFIFDALLEAYNNHLLPKNPYEVSRLFDTVVKKLSDLIKKSGRECTLQDIYNIAYVSTNGNSEIAKNLYDIYEKYGMDVFIDVSATTDGSSAIKSYDGVTIETGYSDPCMINDLERNSARIRSLKDNPVRVYYFQDPLDCNEMDQLFQKIIETNIIQPTARGTQWTPTVIMVPKIGRDSIAYLRRLTQFMHRFPEEMYSQKPQILIITNYLGLPENYVEHIATLCGAGPIRKYIDDAKYKSDVKNGLAATLDNVVDFCGYCGEVEATATVTKFTNPDKMYKKDNGATLLDDDGNPVPSEEYKNIINFLEAEIRNAKATGQNANTLGSLKRQLNAVKANMVEFFVGGISISDRDALRDLVEDAGLNCRSAATNGVGYGANIMGINCFDKLESDGKFKTFFDDYDDEQVIAGILRKAYLDTLKCLYSTMYDGDELDEVTKTVLNKHVPVDLVEGYTDEKILTSIESEPAILNTISKIITIMFTSNQALLQAPNLTMYYRK